MAEENEPDILPNGMVRVIIYSTDHRDSLKLNLGRH